MNNRRESTLKKLLSSLRDGDDPQGVARDLAVALREEMKSDKRYVQDKMTDAHQNSVRAQAILEVTIELLESGDTAQACDELAHLFGEVSVAPKTVEERISIRKGAKIVTLLDTRSPNFEHDRSRIAAEIRKANLANGWAAAEYDEYLRSTK